MKALKAREYKRFEDIKQIRASRYALEADPLTNQIQRLKDEEQTDEIVAKIESLKERRKKIVAKIQVSNPYLEEITDE